MMLPFFIKNTIKRICMVALSKEECVLYSWVLWHDIWILSLSLPHHFSWGLIFFNKCKNICCMLESSCCAICGVVKSLFLSCFGLVSSTVCTGLACWFVGGLWLLVGVNSLVLQIYHSFLRSPHFLSSVDF